MRIKLVQMGMKLTQARRGEVAHLGKEPFWAFLYLILHVIDLIHHFNLNDISILNKELKVKTDFGNGF